jgi:general secretion pathway protein J
MRTILPVRGQRAFTLVEVLLAIGILTLVITGIYATWTAILRATKAGQTVAIEVQRSRVALRCLEESLTYAEMYVANINHYAFVAENGSSATLSFVSRLPESFPRSGRFGGVSVRRVAFSLEPGANQNSQLVLRQSPLLNEFDQDEREHPLVLMENVKRMEMLFWDMREQDWVDEWTQTNQMPALIRVSIVTDNPRSPNDRGEEYTRIVSPATVAVQPMWQGVGGGAPGQPGRPGQPGQPGQPPVMPPIAPPSVR